MIKIWVIYARTTDYPAWPYVMREHHIQRRKGERDVTPTENFHLAETIEELRRRIPKGKIRMLRTEGDEPQIVEWWY
jgi:hypothetical protein